jgi:ferredoxin-NADP reductase
MIDSRDSRTDSIMSRFRIQLRHRELVAERTMAFHFERPSGFQLIHDPAARNLAQQLWLFLFEPPSGGCGVSRRSADGREYQRVVSLCADDDQDGGVEGALAGETGVINREMLNRHLLDLQGPVYYIAPAMATAMHGMLVAAGVDEDDVRSEEFAGY